MATDILLDKVASEDLDFNEIFLKIGTMNPKELYLTDLTHCQDTSSSDSGISTLDDFHDVANMTDLNNVLDTDLKDFDFGLGLMSPKVEHDELFDPDSFIKAEPYSPQAFTGNDILADFFLPDDIMTIEGSSPSTALSSHQFDLSSPETWAYSLNNHPSITTNSNSPPPQTQPWPSPSSQCSPSTTTYSQTYHPSPTHQTSNNVQDTDPNTCRKDSPQYIITPPSSPSSIIMLPSIKTEKQISILPCPSSRLVSVGGGHTPISVSCNIDLILNSKVKIQPKPGSEVIIPEAASPQWITTSANSPVPLSSHHQTSPIIAASSLISCMGVSTVTDEKSLKRAQRIIKNRESASLSRKRKKEYMSSLEERLQQCRHENERLLRENETLRQQLQQLQRENTGLKLPGLTPAKKVCIMCFVFLLTLNLSPFSFLGGPSSVGSNTGVGPSYHSPGRHLMSLPDDSPSRTAEFGSGAGARMEYWSSDILMQLDEELSLLAERLNITGKLGNMCPTYFNFTESNRLAEQLRGWMISQEEEKKKTEKSGQQKKKKDNPPLRHFGKSSYSKNKPHVADDKVGGSAQAAAAAGGGENNYPVQVFSGSYDPRQHLLNAIPRRNDTFYVLSFSTDYFLVPATAHNKTMRPRMSLLMPVWTSSINGSTNGGSDSVGMMQIDCEIFSTNIINVHRSAFPQEPRYNFTSHAPASSTAFERKHESRGSSRNRSEERSGTGASHDHEYWKRLNQTTP